MLNFPDAPTTNQIFAGPNGSFLWDGTKWAPYGAGGPSFAPPSAQVGLAAIPGVAASAMRSDAAPALSQAIVPTWTGKHAFSAGLTAAALVDAAATVRSTAQTAPSSGAGVEILYSGGTGYVQSFDRTASAWKPIQIVASGFTLNGGPVSITDTTGAANSASGALTVAGGIGVGGSVTLANTSNIYCMDSAGAARSVIQLDNTNPDVLHLKNNQRGVGGTISIEPKAGGAASITALANGNVGIGATAPGYTLVVNNGAITNPSNIQITNGTYSGFMTAGNGQDSLNLSGGMYYNGSAWISTATTGATLFGVGANSCSIYQAPSGQTIGNTPTFSMRAQCTPAGGWQAQGTTTNDNPTAGFIGEYVESIVGWGTNISLTSGTTINVTSISLTAGDWDVEGAVSYNGGTTTRVNGLYASISTASAAFNNNCLSGFSSVLTAIFGNAAAMTVSVTRTRISVAATTTVYLVGWASFDTSTCVVIGARINARRRR